MGGWVEGRSSLLAFGKEVWPELRPELHKHFPSLAPLPPPFPQPGPSLPTRHPHDGDPLMLELHWGSRPSLGTAA